MKELVIDASVLMKFVLTVNEPDLEAAEKLKADILRGGKFQVVVPIFWSYEIGNVILTKVTIPEKQEEALSLLLNLQVQAYASTLKEHQEILKLGRTHRTTYYDTSYYYLSKIRDCEMITADDKFIRAVKDHRVRHLKEYPW